LIPIFKNKTSPTEPFGIPGAIYGRARPLAELKEAFRWASLGSTELVLLSGSAGIGKSALVLEAFRPVVWNRSYFAWGKFDPYNRSKPYGIWIQCFRFLVRRLLTEPEEALNRWKVRFAEAAGANISVMAEEIPELRLLFDDLQPAPPLPPKENQNRFEWVCRRFAQTFAGSRRPLVLFLDDLQWADRASLELMHSLAEDPENQHICIIGAYRDGEWTDHADIREKWTSGETAGFSVRSIRLDHLGMNDVQRMVADALRMSSDACFPLAHALYVKSVGNPLYLKHLLQSALDEGVIHPDESARRWRWDEEKLAELPGIDGHVDYLIGRINKLPGAASTLLAYASTLGGMFSARLVGVIARMDEREVAAHFKHAVRSGLLAVRDAGETRQRPARYAFTHNRILQAAYSLLDEEERRRIHLAAGTHLLRERESGATEDDPFAIANHLNAAGELADESLTEIGIRLNEEAGRLAMKSSDYATALRHFRHALDRMPARYWKERQSFAFGTLLACCECEYLCANYERAEAMLDDALARAVDWDQRARVVKVKIDQYSNTGQYAKAIEWGLATIREAGIRVSASPSSWTIRWEVTRAKRLFLRHEDRFREISPHPGPHADRLVELFASLIGPTFFSNRGVLAVLSSQLIRYFFRHGTPAGAPAVYTAFGMVLTTKFGDFADGYRVGRLAVELAERSGDALLLSKTWVLFHAVVSQWMTKDEAAARQLWEASKICVESGDYVFGSYALGGLINLSYGTFPLPEFDRVLRRSLQISELTNEELVYTNIALYMELCKQLQTPGCRAFILEGEHGDEERSLGDIRRLESGAVTLYQIYTYKTQAHYLFGDVEEAIRCARLAVPYEQSAVQSPHKFILHFYETMALAAAARRRPLSAGERRRLRARRLQFARWSRMSPERFGHALLLIRAETQTGNNTDAAAIRLYDEAISLARKRRDWQVWAVACERSAVHHESRGRRRVAEGYLQEAYEAYARWGAEAKCAELIGQYGPRVVPPQEREAPAAASPDEPVPQPAEPSDDDQWLSALKESLQYPKDPGFEQTRTLLFRRLMTLSRAVYGCLIAAGDEGLRVERQWIGMKPRDGRRGKAAPVESAAPRTLVQYAMRVSTPVQVKDIRADELFRYDPYVASARSPAVCCLPIRLQDEPAGILYLELPAASFPPDGRQLDALTVLAAQMLFYTRLSEAMREPSPRAEEDADEAEAGPIVPLTDREYEVLQLISQGLTNKEIAMRLGVTPGTVKVHTNNIFNKLNVNRRTQAIIQARKLRLLDL